MPSAQSVCGSPAPASGLCQWESGRKLFAWEKAEEGASERAIVEGLWLGKGGDRQAGPEGRMTRFGNQEGDELFHQEMGICCVPGRACQHCRRLYQWTRQLLLPAPLEDVPGDVMACNEKKGETTLTRLMLETAGFGNNWPGSHTYSMFQYNWLRLGFTNNLENV